MGKTHEALERAEKQYLEHLRAAPREPLQKAVTSTLGQTSIRNNKNRYKDIKNNLLTRKSDGSIKSVLFIDTSNGGKSSDRAIRFAASLTEDSRLNVAIVDLNLWTLSLQQIFKVDHDLGLSDLFSQDGKKTSPINKVGPGNLYTVRLGRDHSGFIEHFESSKFNHFLKKMGERFDYLILNAPATASFQECRILCSKVDAVVLVLKSGKIARQIALNAKKYIENPEDKLLGVVINKTSTYHNQLVKVASVVVVICLIFTFGIFLGNSQLKLREASSPHYYRDIIPNIKSETIKSEKSANLAQMKHQAKTKTVSDGAFAGVPKEKIDMQTKMAGEQIHELPKTVIVPMEAKKQESIMTPENAPSQRVALKAGQAQVRAPQTKIKSDASEVGEQIHDVQKTQSLPAGKEIEKPMLSPGVGVSPGEKDSVKASKSKTMVVKEGDNLFRIILRTYGTYNEKLVSLVLSENPEISSPQEIVVGEVIKLPEVK
jgi:Mrp family chromosome partitioning ATPase